MTGTAGHRCTVGLAGLYFPVMAAREYGIFESAVETVGALARNRECDLVVWPKLISDPEEARKASAFFVERGIDFLLVQASSLAMGDTVLPLVEGIDRIGVWVVDEPTFSGELPLNSLTGYNLCVSKIRSRWGSAKKLRWFRGSGEDFSTRLDSTLQSLSALKTFDGSRIASIGGLVPTFENLEIDSASFQAGFGLDIVDVSLETLFEIARQAPSASVRNLADELTARARCVRVTEGLLEDTARICFAIREIRDRESVDACALRCWPEFQSWKNIAPCAAIAWSNDYCMPAACEGDVAGAAAMLLGRIVSGVATTMNDPVALDTGTASVQMWHCGPGPASWADGEGQCLDYHHTLNRRLEPGAPRAGVSSDIRFARGPVTMLRMRGDGKSLFVLEGEVVDGPAAPYPGSGGWIGKLSMGKMSVTPEDLLQMMATYGLEHHYPVMRGHHFATVWEIAAWAGWTVLPWIDAFESPIA